MIATCKRCNQDFLTEADIYITTPRPQGYFIYCDCEIRELKTKVKELQAENAKLRECLSWYDGLGLAAGYAKNLLKELEKR